MRFLIVFHYWCRKTKILPFVAYIAPKFGPLKSMAPSETAHFDPTHYLLVEYYSACMLESPVLQIVFIHPFFTKEIDERTLHPVLADSVYAEF